MACIFSCTTRRTLYLIPNTAHSELICEVDFVQDDVVLETRCYRLSEFEVMGRRIMQWTITGRLHSPESSVCPMCQGKGFGTDNMGKISRCLCAMIPIVEALDNESRN